MSRQECCRALRVGWSCIVSPVLRQHISLPIAHKAIIPIQRTVHSPHRDVYGKLNHWKCKSYIEHQIFYFFLTMCELTGDLQNMLIECLLTVTKFVELLHTFSALHGALPCMATSSEALGTVTIWMLSFQKQASFCRQVDGRSQQPTP